MALSRVVLCVLLLLCVTKGFADERRVALVVGNSAYETAPALPNTLNDARAVGAVLEKLGFTVFAAYDAPQAALLNTFSDFSDALDEADAAIFFYAGHGIQVGAENYILPIDIEVENELSIRYGALSLTDVVDDMESKAPVAIVILDACRNNPYAELLAKADPKRAAVLTRGLAPVTSSGSGTIIAYAAAPGAVAADGEGEHSPYTQALLAEMEKPGVEVGLLFRRVAGRVIEETAGQQRPELLVRLASEYYLANMPASAPLAVDLGEPAGALPGTAIALGTGIQNPTQVTSEPTIVRTTEPSGEQDRPALWGYAATLSEEPFDVAAPLWTAPEGSKVAEQEPNDSLGWAQQVSPNDGIEMMLATLGESDWLRLEVGHGGRLTVDVPATPQNIDLNLRLVNANGDEMVYWVGAPRPGGTLHAEYDLARPGTYFLEFADGGRDQSSGEPFPVSLSYAVQEDAFEPNDRIDLAWHLPPNGTHPIAILPKGDRDWFRYTASEPGALHVAMTNVPATLDVAMRLLNADGGEIVYWVSPPRLGGDTIAQFDLPRPGVYYVEVADNGGDASSAASLDLSTRFEPSGDPLEPNDSMAHAVSLHADTEQPVAIFPRGDNDWIELEFAQPGELAVALSSVPETIDPAFRIVDSSGTELQYWTFGPGKGADVAGTFDVARPGRYFVQLADNGGDGSSVMPFALRLDFSASLDAFEPNDGIGSASVLTPGGEVPFTILPRGDVDWFRVSVAEPGELKVWIDEGPPNLDIAYRVVGNDWSELAYWVAPYAMGGLTEGFVDLPAPGTYFLEVRDGSNDARSVEPATLRTAYTATSNANEPNNSFGEATAVDLEGESWAHILPRADGDWHKFYAPGPGRLDVHIDNVPEALGVEFRVLDADRTEIQYWIAAPGPGAETVGSVVLPRAGWYRMEIRDGANDGRSPEPFRVVRQFTPGG